MADGWQLNLYPPGWDAVGWSDFPHRDGVLQWFREELGRDGLVWEVEEFADNGRRYSNWVCPQSRACWLCLESPEGGPLELVQASFPADDNPWAVRLAWVVVQAVCRYQLVVEA